MGRPRWGCEVKVQLKQSIFIETGHAKLNKCFTGGAKGNWPFFSRSFGHKKTPKKPIKTINQKHIY